MKNLKPGTKLLRKTRNSESCKIFVGNIYTILDTKNGWIKLAERQTDGFSWNINNFEVIK